MTLLSFGLTLQNERQGQTSTAANLEQTNGFVKLALTGQMKLIQNDLSGKATYQELTALEGQSVVLNGALIVRDERGTLESSDSNGAWVLHIRLP